MSAQAVLKHQGRMIPSLPASGRLVSGASGTGLNRIIPTFMRIWAAAPSSVQKHTSSTDLQRLKETAGTEVTAEALKTDTSGAQSAWFSKQDNRDLA
jgi:hypothetical protein